jgi:hypothetical protein
MERFSPYFFDEQFPVGSLEPWNAYRFVYPEDEIDLRKIAYFFDYTMGDTVADEHLHGVKKAMQEWRDLWASPRRPVLVYQRAPDWIQVIDRRDPDAPQVHAFRGLDAAAYDLCGDTEHSPSKVASLLREGGVDVDADGVGEILDRFCEHDLMLEEDGRYLSLALPVNGNW